MNDTLQIPSFKKADPSASRGGSTFQEKKAARARVRTKEDPAEHAERPRRADFPLEAKAHLPRDVLEAARFVAGDESDLNKAFRGSRGEQLKQKSARCSKATEK